MDTARSDCVGIKAQYLGRNIDCLFPEEISGYQANGNDSFEPADKLTTDDLLRI